MFLTIAKFIRWLIWRAAFGCVLAALVLAGRACWLQSHDALDFEQRRAALIAEYTGQREKYAADYESAQKRVLDLRAELKTQGDATEDAAQSVEALGTHESSFGKWFGDNERQELGAKLREEQEKKRLGAMAKIAALKKELSSAVGRREMLNVEMARMDVRVESVKTEKSKWGHYARIVWAEWRWVAVVIVVAWVLWLPVRRFFAYYFFAPFVVRRKAFRAGKKSGADASDDAGAIVREGELGRTLDIELWPGELLRVKPEWVQSAGAGLSERRGVRFAKGHAITRAICGLTGLVEYCNESGTKTAPGETGQGGETSGRTVVLRGLGKWKGEGRDVRRCRAELALVRVPEGASFVLRPRYLAGVAHADEEPLVLRAHWRFFSVHAWVTGQFRFFEFNGPCQLIVAGQRGVQADRVEPREDGLRPARRVPVWTTMGFASALRFRPARTQAFGPYCKGERRLYDDLFVGTGLYLVQKTPVSEGRYDQRRGMIGRFFAARWRSFQKIFGI